MYILAESFRGYTLKASERDLPEQEGLMKFYLISDNVDTLMGMHLAGINGVVVHEENEVKEALSRAMEMEDVAVILMTEKLVQLCPELVYELKLNRKQPLIVEIPDRHGSGRAKDSITIEKYAEEQRSKIQSEAEDFKERELNKAEEEGLREAYVLIQKKMSDIRTQISAELSRAETASRRKTFVRRQEIEKEVFEKAAQKLREYTKTEKYLKSLLNSTKEISMAIQADDVVLKLRKEDLVHKNQIFLAFGRKCEIVETDEIIIGGILGVSKKLGMLADETLDSRLEQQHEWFFENSGLKVTE